MIRSKIILASSSPRRRELLRSLLGNFGLRFDVIPANIEESLPQKSSDPGRLALKLSKIKAECVASKHKGIIIAADTIVEIKKRILGKPKTAGEAKKMLMLLRGKSHHVYTGICIINNHDKKVYTALEKTLVKFRNISAGEIEFYVKSGSPFDKAGAYGIQDDFGSTFVTSLKGDFFNVVGLPIVKTYNGLKNFIDLGV